jgi:DNA-binding LytR/AlgR family response regulator
MNNKAVILIVDDEIKIVNALKRVLHKMDCEILSATSPEDAIKIIDQSEYDIVICDYCMPNINGIDVLRHSKKVIPHAARVLMTGYSDVNIAISAVNEGSIFYYISKPWTTSDLTSMVQYALEHKRSMKAQSDMHQVLNGSTGSPAIAADKVKSAGEKPESGNPKIPIPDDEAIHLVNKSDVLYLTAIGGDVLVSTVNGEYKSHGSLNSWSQKLGMDNFFRCHRSYIVNIEKIERISLWFNGAYNLKLKNCKDTIPVSRENVKALKGIFGI